MYSCDEIYNKTEEVAKKVKKETEEQIQKQSQKVKEKLYPTFDHDKPDTENNKKRFKDFIKVKITDDVRNIYCYDDAVGIDSDYMFSFYCSSETSEKIKEKHDLTMDTLNSDDGFGMQDEFDWWDKDRIKELDKYSWTNGDQYYKYYWYDEENGKAYFFDFDI